QNLKTNCCGFFNSNNDYKVFKNEVEALHFTFNKKKIELAIESVKQAAKKAYKCWHLHRPEIESFLYPALIIPATDPEFYKVFLEAEDAFHKLPNDASMQTEFIDHICQTITKPLSEPLKVPKTAVPKSHLSGVKHEKLKSKKQELEAKKSKNC
ncbi:10840_t:CDS:2, partial [Cetraspora pellucida]